MTDSGAGGTRGRQRAVVIAMVVLLAASAVTAGVGAVAAGSTAATETADTSEENPIKFVYVDDNTGNLTFVRADGTRVGTNVSNPNVVGSMADLDSDGLLEATYVTSNQAVKAVDVNNETQQLGTNARTSVRKSASVTGRVTGYQKSCT